MTRLIYATADALDSGAESVADQTKVALDRLKAELSSSGASLEHIVKAVCYLSDNGDRMEFWSAYGEVMGDHAATRLTLAAGLEPGAKVLLDVIAERP
jgi:enamine deaminase RidA (YjgF/YER057c/UK114 family)